MTMPCLHSIVPYLCLPDLRGREISLFSYKHQQPVVLVFCNDIGLLNDFAERYAEYRAENAEIIAVLPVRPMSLDWPFPVLLDAAGETAARFAERLPTILVLDSFNELQARVEGPWKNGPDHRKILGWIAEVELKCPECGVPEWPYPQD